MTISTFFDVVRMTLSLLSWNVLRDYLPAPPSLGSSIQSYQARVIKRPTWVSGPRYHTVEFPPWEGGPDEPVELKVKAGFLCEAPPSTAQPTSNKNTASADPDPASGIGVGQTSPSPTGRGSGDRFGRAASLDGVQGAVLADDAEDNAVTQDTSSEVDTAGKSRQKRRVSRRRTSKAALGGHRRSSDGGSLDGGSDGDEQGQGERGGPRKDVERTVSEEQADGGDELGGVGGPKKGAAVETPHSGEEMDIDEEEKVGRETVEGEREQGAGKEKKHEDDNDDSDHDDNADAGDDDDDDGDEAEIPEEMKAADGEVWSIPVGTRAVLVELPKWSNDERGGPNPKGRVKVAELLGKTVSVK